jgi:hypothetical protein
MRQADLKDRCDSMGEMGEYVMPAESAAALLSLLGDHQVNVCVGGGCGVDALLKVQACLHADPDVTPGAAVRAPPAAGFFVK